MMKIQDHQRLKRIGISIGSYLWMMKNRYVLPLVRSCSQPKVCYLKAYHRFACLDSIVWLLFFHSLGNFLYNSGYSVTACADPEALFHVLSSTEREPDVIVSDIRMPNASMDGLKLLSLLKGKDEDMGDEYSRWRDIPVILLTAKSLTPDRIAGYRLGAQAYLSKPFSPDELLSIIDNLIRRRVEQSQSNLDIKTLDLLKDDLENIKSLLKQSPEQKVVDVDYGKEGFDSFQKSNVQLTPTEIEVLLLLCEGYSNSEIASKRGKSPIGVGKVISTLYLKSRTKTRTELLRWAVQNSYIK